MDRTIDPELAKSLIREYQQQNAAEGGPALKTPEGFFLNGFFIDRESLEQMLDDPNALGISIHLSKHPDFTGSPENVFTLVYATAQLNTTGGSAPYVNTGTMCCAPPPCPPICSKLPEH